MRVLMLTSSYPKYPGETTAPFIEEIAAGLAARGHTIDLVAPWHPDIRREPVERGVRLHFFRYAPHPALNIWGYAQSLLSDVTVKRRTLAVLPFALAGTVRALQLQIADCRLQIVEQSRVRYSSASAQRDGALSRSQLSTLNSQFDLIHAHWVLPNGVPAALVARRAGLPLVISLHGSDVYLAERHPALALSAAWAFRSAAAVTACSRNLQGRGVQLGARAETSSLIPYGINPQEFRPDASAYNHVRSELGLAPDTPLVLGLGRLVAKKGYDVLLDAWPQVLACHPNAVLAIAGYGDLRPTLERQAESLGLGGRVLFPGQLERKRAAAYVAAADVFALPIVHDQGSDGLPNALLEAMGAGRAVVASRVAGVPDVLDDGVHGLTVPDRNPAQLAAAINRLLGDRGLATRLGAAARQRIETELTWAQTAARFEAVYEAAVIADRVAR
ncbi:MAG: glycosyltransferase [Chloroflexaceae bacterium]|nr:glycosyltransferase [Chloroflexaceae bacterium]